MNIKVIHTEAEYLAARAHISKLFDNQPKLGTHEADQFELLTMAIERYEDAHYPVTPPNPIDALKFRTDQMGLSAPRWEDS